MSATVTVTVEAEVPLSDIDDEALVAELIRRREVNRSVGQPPEAVFFERLYYALRDGNPDEIRRRAEELCRINDFIL